jgi:parallel beta-helix repeat protein
MKRIALLLLLAAVLHLGARPASAQNVVVGRCMPKLKSFATIQAAVLAAPLNGTVFVCPGNYPEQVTLSAPVTVEGVLSGTLDRAVISVPPNGLAINTTLIEGGYQIAAQVLVTAGTPSVNITNMTVDGSGGNPSGAFLVGIVYDIGTSGTVNKVTTRNQTSVTSIGIVAQNSLAINGAVTIENSSIHDATFYGIYAVSNQTPPTLTATIRGNRVSTTPITGNGIRDESAGTVVGNVINATSDGIDVLSGSTATVVANTVSNTQRGVTVSGPANFVKSNTIFNSSIAGIQLYGNGATVENNNITEAPVGIEFGCFTGTVSGNTINDASTGIDAVPTSFSLVNTFQNVDTTRRGGC